VRADYLRYSNALASGDYEDACSRMSAAMRRRTIADAPEIQASAGLPAKAVDCAGAVELLVEHVFTPADPGKTKRDVAAAKVEVDGERATLEATSFSAEMAWSGDRWVLDSP
jgi:hypothetical protein